METNPDRLAKDVFLELEGLAPDEREARLSSCDDPRIVRAVRELLGAADQADDFFAQPLFANASEENRTGQRIGAYVIRSLLGQGGMGSVWLAERVDGEFQQTVAIKILRSHVRDEETKARFRSEREILAGLFHPAIAALYDGGVAPDGRPYFVMEHVDGVPVDQFCAQRDLDVDSRLRLLLQVCDALEHAHDRGIVHRDVKPANVLVTPAGDVKLLDFGIAKLQRARDSAVQVETGTGVTPMTPAYASPEQISGGDVSPATDTYALGVMMYLLLTEELPYSAGADSPLELARSICDTPVQLPSRRLAMRRQSTSGTYRRMRGDLDTIVMMALRKEPHRRYPSAGALAEDIRRHLNQFPVRARADSVMYRVNRFIVRHKHAAGIGAVALVATAVSLGATVVLARSNSAKAGMIEEERSGRAELLDHLVGLYESADPWTPGANAGTRALLDAAVERLRDESGGDRETRATLLHAAGRVYSRLADYGRARVLIQEALELRRAVSKGPSAELAECIFDLGTACGASGAGMQGAALVREALDMEIELHGPDHLNVARARCALAKAGHDQGGASEEHFQEALRIFRLHKGEPTEEYAQAVQSRAEFIAATGEPIDAVEFSREAVQISEQLYGDEHPAYAKAVEGLGMIYCAIGRKSEGIELLREALDINRITYAGMNHPSLAWNLLNLGGHLAWSGDELGVDLTREAVEMYRDLPTRDHSALGFALTSLGRILASRDSMEAIQVLEGAIQVYEEGHAHEGHMRVARLKLASLYEGQGAIERAIELLERVVGRDAARRGEDDEGVRELRDRIEALRVKL